MPKARKYKAVRVWWVYGLAIGIPTAHSALCPACGHVDWLTAFRAFFGAVACPSCWQVVKPTRVPWLNGPSFAEGA